MWALWCLLKIEETGARRGSFPLCLVMPVLLWTELTPAPEDLAFSQEQLSKLPWKKYLKYTVKQAKKNTENGEFEI